LRPTCGVTVAAKRTGSILVQEDCVNAKGFMLVAVVASLVLVAGTAYAGVANVPEPTSMGLLGIGAAVAAVGAWWKNRK
jgi:hypothetical protein